MNIDSRRSPAQDRHRRTLRAALCLLAACLLAPPLAQAATRAWLDRSATALGEAVTLNIETDQPGVAPDYAPLQADFDLGEQYRTDPAGQPALFGVSLAPRRSGTLQIPALRVGAERTAPLSLQVVEASPRAPRGDVFIETRVDDPSPYVQQSVGVTVRLHYATPLLSGELTQDAPDGASLQRVGDDVQSSREVGGRRYRVVERRYLLVPERSGPLELPPARFRGQAAGGFFDDFFGSDRRLAAEGQAQRLQVRAQPDAAPQPWLPLRDLRLRYVAAPAQGRAGDAVEIVVEAVAQGATAAQFPEIPVPQVEGAQVFAERADSTERFVDGGPQLTVVRRFSVVPLRAGSLRVPGPRLDWWNIADGAAQVATLPELQLQIEPGVAADANAAAGGGAAASATVPAPAAIPLDPASPAGFARSPWRWLAVLFALLWLATLGWVLWLRRRAVPGAPAGPRAAAGSGAAAAPRPVVADLRRALDAGSFGDAVRTLQRMATPAAADLDEVLARLSDPAQREALDAMRRALWAGQGEPAAARAALRTAFRDGPRWTPTSSGHAAPLPPLYPRSRKP